MHPPSSEPSPSDPPPPAAPTPTPAAEADARRGFAPVAGVVALLIPGMGHAVLGLRRRGSRIAAGVFGLFALGLVVGGLDAVDSREDRWWYMGQAMVGPAAWAADYAHQSWFKHDARDSAMPRKPAPGEVVTSAGTIEFGGAEAPRPAMGRSLGRVNEIGSLACALAGLMNAIAIIDAAFPPLRRRREGLRL
ncbi:MAG: DUF6677 family protein [Planctomycetota bacterium]